MSSLMVPPAAPAIAAETLEKVLLQGDLERLASGERLHYYNAVCQSVGLNPLTRPFEYIKLNGKLTLYAKRECTEQLRTINKVSLAIKSREVTEGCYVVTACATMPNGRTDESIGAVPIEGLKGEARANALMKAETKAKRRVTMAICGLSFLDETEVDSIAGAKHVPVDPISGEIIPGTKEAAQFVGQQKIAQFEKDRIAREAAAKVVEEPHYEVEPGYLPDEIAHQANQKGPGLQPPTEQQVKDFKERLSRVVRPPEPGLEPPHDEQLLASVAMAHEGRFRSLYDGYTALGKVKRYHAQIKSFGVKVYSDFDLTTKPGQAQADRCFAAMTRDLSELEEQLKPKESDTDWQEPA